MFKRLLYTYSIQPFFRISYILVVIVLTSLDLFAVETVANVDLNKYAGQWYEVASIPSSFQKVCLKNPKARYKLREDGKIEVRNTCIKKSGQREVAMGVAKVVNEKTNAELKVSFVPIFKEFGLFGGQYKILSLDPNYQYVLIGEDNLEYGWILSRKPGLPLDVFAHLEADARNLGYDSCRFLTSVQDRGFFSKRKALCEVVKNNPRSLENSDIF
jgi:apolipoprotein D and lipocalin family protein